MLIRSESISTPNSRPRCANDATLAEWIRFLLGRHAMFGHEPPNHLRSTRAVRRPSLAFVQARYLPASPLPRTRISYLSASGIVQSPSNGLWWTALRTRLHRFDGFVRRPHRVRE